VSTIYSAVRPSGEEPELQGDFPKLKVQLRPYQRRAAAWMVAREVRINLTHPDFIFLSDTPYLAVVPVESGPPSL
jgi:hypothetical protein